LNCSTSVIHRALNRFNIKLRGRHARYKLLSDKKWLISKYEIDKLSLNAIAKLIGCSVGSVRSYLLSYGATLRKATGIISRKGGKRRYIKVSNHPMALENGYITETRFILEHYYGKQLEEIGCQYQGCKIDFVLETHHRDSNAYNNDPSNLVILCPTHHKAIERKVLKEQYDVRKMVQEKETN